MNYILSHKNFTWDIQTKDKSVALVEKSFDIKTNLPILKYNFDKFSSKCYGEFPAWKFIYENSSDNINTLHHYRRYLVDQTVNTVAKPIIFGGSLADQYAYYHSEKMAVLLNKIIGNDLLIKTNMFFPYNIFCADKKTVSDWLSYCEYFINKIVKILNIDYTYESIRNFVSNESTFTKPRIGKNTSLDYQTRMFSFIIERLNSLFWIYEVKKFNISEVKFLEPGQKI